MPDNILEVRKVSKGFPGVQALKDVDFFLRPGEIHTLLGENGSGKSTLFRVVAGIYQPDSGGVLLDGRNVGRWNPAIAQENGVAIIHQELSLFPDLSVAENIFLEQSSFTTAWGWVDWKRAHAEAGRLLDYLKARNISPRVKVEALSVAERQIVEIAKALAGSNLRILLMDEPTSALSVEETRTLFDIMRKLRNDGVGIVFISHKLDEVFAVSDRVTVLRDGNRVGTENIADIAAGALIGMMVGRDLGDVNTRPASHAGGEAVLEVKNLSRGALVRDVSFTLHKGEILGFFGLVGSGRTELAETIFGIARATSGSILLDGRGVDIRDSNAALNAGLGLIPEDRGAHGLVLRMSLYENATLSVLDRMFPRRVVNRAREKDAARRIFDTLDVRYRDVSECVDNLSGGNKQKIVLAKWLLGDARALIFDEPTKGVDVGAKDVIHQLMDKLASEGMGIIMISSEMPEILKMSDRILVMCGGEISGEFRRGEASQDEIMIAASPGAGGKAAAG
ncbi:MAG: sugar ABC transporter ATP-binding protein [Planctomycetota bacterium]|nr:sugar ABC transporter ATP-binding protein [Planctomycetota bacterium]